MYLCEYCHEDGFDDAEYHEGYPFHPACHPACLLAVQEEAESLTEPDPENEG